MRGLEHVMMIVPVDPDIEETQNIAQEHRPQLDKDLQVITVRNFHFQHHNGDDDRDDSITERFESVFFHAYTLESSHVPPGSTQALHQALELGPIGDERSPAA